jgi:hypothetical protein
MPYVLSLLFVSTANGSYASTMSNALVAASQMLTVSTILNALIPFPGSSTRMRLGHRNAFGGPFNSDRRLIER